MKKASSAFTLIEIMVVVILVGIMATMIFPRLVRRSPSVEWPNILDEVNNLVFFARQEAISNLKNYRLKFRSVPAGKDFIDVEEERDVPGKSSEKTYAHAYSAYFETKYELAEQVRISAVYIGKKETMHDNKGEAYCYIVPDGLVQDVLVHLTRRLDGQEEQVTFKMQPFLGTFQFIEKHVRPEK